MQVLNGTLYTDQQLIDFCEMRIPLCDLPAKTKQMFYEQIRDRLCDLADDVDTYIGEFVVTNPVDGDGVIVLVAPILDIDGEPTGDTRTITIPEETDGVNFAGQPTIDANGIVTFPQVNDLDQTPAAPIILDLSSLISDPHPIDSFAGDLTVTPNATGGFDVTYDDPDLIAGDNITITQDAGGNWVLVATDTFGTASPATADGIDSFGVVYNIGDKLISFPDGTSCAPRATTTIVDNGNGTFSSTDADGNVVTWAVGAQITDNNDGTFSSTDVNGLPITWDANAATPSTSLLQDVNGGQSIPFANGNLPVGCGFTLQNGVLESVGDRVLVNTASAIGPSLIASDANLFGAFNNYLGTTGTASSAFVNTTCKQITVQGFVFIEETQIFTEGNSVIEFRIQGGYSDSINGSNSFSSDGQTSFGIITAPPTLVLQSHAKTLVAFNAFVDPGDSFNINFRLEHRVTNQAAAGQTAILNPKITAFYFAAGV